MLNLSGELRVFVCIQPADMRRRLGRFITNGTRHLKSND